MTIDRDSVVSGSLRPLRPIALGQKVEKSLGSLDSGSQRTTPWPRVHPELTTSRRSSLRLKMVSASSMTKHGCHFSIERNSAADEIPTLGNVRCARKLMTPRTVDLPEFASADVTMRIGLCVSLSCTQVIVIH